MSAQLGSACPVTALQRNPTRDARQTGWTLLLTRVLRVIRTRQHLAELDAHMLRDIGLSKADARAEAGRAPWDLPRDFGGRF